MHAYPTGPTDTTPLTLELIHLGLLRHNKIHYKPCMNTNPSITVIFDELIMSIIMINGGQKELAELRKVFIRSLAIPNKRIFFSFLML